MGMGIKQDKIGLEMYYNPPEDEIKKVMENTGMQRMQAIRHLQWRHDMKTVGTKIRKVIHINERAKH